MVRGKPSKRKPLTQSAWVMRSLTRLMIRSSETRPPLSITLLAFRPSSVPALTAARSMSPVEICGIPNFLVMKPAWVPLPAPGAPSKITRIDVLLKIQRKIVGLASWGQSQNGSGKWSRRGGQIAKGRSRYTAHPQRTSYRKSDRTTTKAASDRALDRGLRVFASRPQAPKVRALPGIAQPRGNPRHTDQQSLFQRAVGLVIALPGAGQQLGLKQVQGVQIGVAHADRLQGLGTVPEQLRLPGQPQYRGHRLRQ